MAEFRNVKKGEEAIIICDDGLDQIQVLGTIADQAERLGVKPGVDFSLEVIYAPDDFSTWPREEQDKWLEDHQDEAKPVELD